MPVIEITKTIGSPPSTATLTLKRNTKTGKLLLGPFIPLLKQLHEDKDTIDVAELRDDLANTALEQDTELQKVLLSKFGMLDADTDGGDDDGDDDNDNDNNGNDSANISTGDERKAARQRWIPLKYASRILKMLDIYDLFKEELNNTGTDIGKVADNRNVIGGTSASSNSELATTNSISFGPDLNIQSNGGVKSVDEVDHSNIDMETDDNGADEQRDGAGFDIKVEEPDKISSKTKTENRAGSQILPVQVLATAQQATLSTVPSVEQQQQQQQQQQQRNNSAGNTSDSNIEKSIPHKRPSEFDRLGVDASQQQQPLEEDLVSPLKKMKFGKGVGTKFEDIDGDLGPIYTFSHDIPGEMLTDPLKLHRALPVQVASSEEQRIKLEGFLQRLLFPEGKALSSSSENKQTQSSDNNPNSDLARTFETLSNEVNTTFPNVELNLDIPVDEQGNTPSHWLASIANLDLLKEFVKHKSNRLVGDKNGESPLVKAVKSVNNYDSGTFERLLDYLYPCLILEDSMNRTILHHIVITSGMTGCSVAAKYYLDILMGWLVKKQNRKSIDYKTQSESRDPLLHGLGLKWVISNLLNAQDLNGDTCLNIAARLGNVAIVDALLDYGADAYIPNKSGLRPIDFGAGASKLHLQTGSNMHSVDFAMDKGNGGNNSSANVGQNANTDATSTSFLAGTTAQEKTATATETETAAGVAATATGTKLPIAKKPDTTSLLNDIQTLLAAVSKDYEIEVSQYNTKLSKLRDDLSAQREQLASSRERLNQAKDLRDEYNLLREQLKNVENAIVKEEKNFSREIKKLGMSTEEATGADWNSSEFDADEPFRIGAIYDLLENKLKGEYNGDVEKFFSEQDVDSLANYIRESFNNDESKLESILPPAPLLKARISAYRKNDQYLDNLLNDIVEGQKKLEDKFRRVLSLCLKVDEDKVDDMLDGLLQAITSEDPNDIDTEEIQDFLRKHAV